MKVKCPKCSALYRIDPSKVAKDVVKIRCKKCSAVFAVRIKREEEAKKEAPAPPPPPPKRTVLLGIEDEARRSDLSSKLKSANFEVISAGDGLEVLDILSSEKPDVLLLDVILPKVFGFEIAEIARKRESLKGMKIVLISSYERDRYVRPSDESYGADRIIQPKELEELPAILRDILKDQSGASQIPTPQEAPTPQKATTAPPEPSESLAEEPSQPTAGTQPSAKQILQEEHKKIEEEFKDLSPEERQEVEKAKRLARLIVSDILLYNADKVEEGVRNGTFFTLLEKDIEDGRKLFVERVPEWVRKRWDFLNDELNALIEKKKKELGIS